MARWAEEYFQQVAEDLAAEWPLKLRKNECNVIMCADYAEAEAFLTRKAGIIRASGLVFLEFFTERFFAHMAGLGIGVIDGEIAFLPIRFYCKEMNVGAKDLLQFKLPTLENLLRDAKIGKVIENRLEFCSVLQYLSWHELGIQPFLDVLGILQEVGSRVNFGKMTALRTIFPSSRAHSGWNSEETLCHDNYWQIPNYPRTPTFDRPDASERVIAAQVISLVITTCK